jgi:uncharacterized membrane protein YkvI
MKLFALKLIGCMAIGLIADCLREDFNLPKYCEFFIYIVCACIFALIAENCVAIVSFVSPILN